jgi:hypothetical protein
MVKIKKEFLNYFMIFIILSLAMHFSAWLDHPIEHLKSLSDSSMGFYHPFIIAFLIYFIFFIFRKVINLFTKK